MPNQTAQKSPKTDDQKDLLREYKNWFSSDYPDAELLQEYLEFPSKSLWLQACHQAVKDENREWLENPPLELLYCRSSESNAVRKNTARFISNCALKSLLIKQAGKLNGGSEISLQSIVKDIDTSDESAKDLIQYLALGAQSLEGETAAVKVLLAGNEGKLGQLEIEKIPSGEGKIFPDPAVMSFSRFQSDFEESIQTALKYIINTERLKEAKKYNYRWRLFDRSNTKKEDNNFRVLDQPLRGSSIGFASALAFRQLFKPVKISLGKYAFTGRIDENGVLESVGEYPGKLQAGKNFVIYFPDVDHEKINHYREDGYSIKEAVSVKDAIADIKNKNRKQRLISASIITGIVAGIILLATSVYAWRASSLQAKNERQQKELISRQRELEKKYDDQELELERQRTDVAQKDAEAQKQDKLNEENKRKNAEKETQLSKERETLAKQQSKILAQKNVQLDAAKQTAEKNEKEATFQKGVAEKNERIAKASQQAAYASRLATEGYKRLSEGDKASAQTFFAKALSLDEQEEYRTGLLNASFDSGNNSYKLSWSKKIADDIETSCCPATALSLNGNLLAVSHNNGRNVKIISTQDGNVTLTFSFEKRVVDVALSNKGEYLAVKDVSGYVSILETTTQNKLSEFDALPDESLQSLVFSDDNDYLATISGSHSIIVFDTQNKKVSKTINHEGDFASLKLFYITFSADNLLAYAFNDGPIFITSVFDESVNKRINMWSPHLGLGFTKSGDLISSDGDIEIYPDIRETFNQQGMPDSKSIRQKVRPDFLIATNSSVPYFASVGDAGIIHFRAEDEQIQQISFPMGKPVKLMLGENGKVLFQNTKGEVYCWEPYTSNYKKYELNEDVFYAAGFTRYLEQEKEAIVVKDFKSEDIIFSLKLNQPDKKLYSANISEDRKTLAVSQDGKSVETYDVENGKRLFQYSLKVDDKIDQIIFLVLNNDGSKIALIGENSIAIISVLSNKRLGIINFPQVFSKHFLLDSIIFSPQDNFLIIQSENSINLFDTITGEIKHSIPFIPKDCRQNATACSWLAISPNEKFVGIATMQDSRIQLWNIENYRHLVYIFKAGVESPEIVNGLDFTKDNQFLTWSSGNSGRLHFYNVISNKQYPDFPINEGIESFMITRSGKFVINGAENYYVTDENNILSLLVGDTKTINSQIFNKTGFKINFSDTRLFPQDELNFLLKDKRPKFPLLAVDQSGLELKPKNEFGGVDTVKPIVKRPSINTTVGIETRNPQKIEEVQVIDKRDLTSTEIGSTNCPTGFFSPSFNPFPITFDDKNTPFCHDFPIIDVALDTKNPRFSKSKEEYLSVRRYSAGDQIAVLMYINNGAYSSLYPTTIAKDVKIITSLIKEVNLYKVSATFVANNAAPVTGNVHIQTNDDEELEVIPNTGFMFDYEGRRILDQQNLNFGNSVYILGDLDPDWQYSLFFTYKLRVVKKK